MLRGSREGEVVVFRGVPFAAPPVGPLRWRPPAPPEAWSGTRDALEFGPPCPQLDDDGKVVGEEDCLQLNLWRPAARTPGELLPVMVFIHGGGHVQGSATVEAGRGEILYDGAELPYVFGDLRLAGYDPPPEEEAMSAAMLGAWASLAANGDPGPVQGVPWPQAAAGDDPYLLLDVPVAAGDGVRTSQCDFWDVLLGSDL